MINENRWKRVKREIKVRVFDWDERKCKWDEKLKLK